jgi:ABC-type Fe3+-citrate transport system substrate-binding protein
MTAKEILNKYRNEYYNATLESIENQIANALDKVLPELERLEKKEKYLNQFKNSKYVVIQDSVAKGFEFHNIKEAVEKLYTLKGNHEYDIGVLACVGGEQVFIIAELTLEYT